MKAMRRFFLVGVIVSLGSIGVRPAAAPAAAATVPLSLDHNRITIAVELRAPGGGERTARAWIDTGGTSLVFAEPLARALGIDVSGLPDARERAVGTKSPSPSIRIAGIPLDTEGMSVSVRAGRVALPGVQADCIVPARCLRRLRVVFDYPARQLTVAPSGTLTPRGTAAPCAVNPTTGLFMSEGRLDGERVALGIDTGSAGTWVSEAVTASALARHPEWPRTVGAAGSTNFFGFPFETRGQLLRLPALTIGPITVSDVAVLGLTQKLFDWYSEKSAAKVAGFVGADVLVRYRLEVDFGAGTCWWQPGPSRGSRDLAIVGISIRPEPDGSYTVAGIVSRNGRPVVEGVEAGDRLLGVGRLDVQNARMGDVIEALRGRPGETRTLRLARAGRQMAVTAPVVQLP